MKKLILAFLLFPVIGKSQSFKRQFNELKNPEIKSELYKSSRRLQTAGASLGIGGGLIGASVILSIDANTQSKQTSAKIIAGSGGLFCLIGGILLGNAGESLLRSRNDKKPVAFTGNSIIYNF